MPRPRRRLALAAGCILAIGCAASSGRVPAPEGAGALSGTVTYRERMALPADAVVDVWLCDLSPGPALTALLGETSVDAGGRQVPIPFRMAVDPARLAPDRDYGVRAVIRGPSGPLFESPEPVLVLTKGRPASVELVLVRASGTGAVAPADLLGTSWALTAMFVDGAEVGGQATMEFPASGRVAGRAFCNRYVGPVELASGRVRVGSLAATQMACAEPLMTQEQRFLAALGRAARIERAGDTLTLRDGAGEALLRFTRVP